MYLQIYFNTLIILTIEDHCTGNIFYSLIKFLVLFFISGTVKATITLQQWENFFFEDSRDGGYNLLKIEYFHLKTLLCIHYLCTNISAKF